MCKLAHVFHDHNVTLINARRYASAVLAVVVCLCVRLPQAGIVSKRLQIRSRKQRRTIAQGSSFLMPKIFSKFEWGHPQRGRQMEVG